MIIKRRIDKVVEKSESLYIISGNVNGAAVVENSMETAQNTKLEVSYDQAIPHLRATGWHLWLSAAASRNVGYPR